MKKTLKILFFTLFAFILLSISKTVEANSINSISMDIFIDDYGNAQVEEIWNCSTSSGTEVYHPYYNLGNSKIQNLTVSEKTKTYETISSWNTSASLSAKAYKCAINKISNGVELCWGISKYGSHTYTVKYSITNFVSELSDETQMIYWTLIPYDFSNPIGTVNIKIYADFTIPNTIDVWGYGNKGRAYVSNGSIQMDSNGRLPSSDYMTILAKFPKGTFSTTNKLDNNFNYYLKMSQKGAKKNPNANADTTSDIFGFLGMIFFASIFVIVFIVAWAQKQTINLGITKKDLKQTKNYFRDIPCDNIYKAYFLAYHGDLLRRKTDILGSIILKWIKDDIVTIQKNNKKSAIVLSITDVSKITAPKELELFNMLVQASQDGILESEEFEKWCKSHYTTILNWFDTIISKEQNNLIASEEITLGKAHLLFFTKNTYNLQPNLTEELKHIAELKRYLLDYTLISKREAIEVHLFEDYLIYAQMLGIADKVAKQFKELYPEIIQNSCYSTYDNLSFVDAWCMSSIMAANYAKSAAESHSSYSAGGGGGSFGGGGGGGGFR